MDDDPIEEACEVKGIELETKSKVPPVNSVVDIWGVDPGIGSFGLSFQVSREEVQIRILGPRVKLAVEHSSEQLDMASCIDLAHDPTTTGKQQNCQA